MTESEAIKIFNTLILFGKCDLQKGEQEEFFNTSINALEKQLPKKPICIEDKMWCCPVCGNNLMHKWIKYNTKLTPKSEGLTYCMSCGQAIDWSE